MNETNGGERKFLAGRRMYHVSTGLLEAALYGIPVSFFGRFAAAQLGPFPTLALGFVVWGLVAVWVVRRADARFAQNRSARPPESAIRSVHNLQTTVLKYAATASLALLAFAVLPLLLSPIFPGAGVWVPLSGFGFFCFVILLGFTAVYSLGGLVSAARDRLYPEYPGFVAAILFAMSLVAFFVTYILSG